MVPLKLISTGPPWGEKRKGSRHSLTTARTEPRDRCLLPPVLPLGVPEEVALDPVSFLHALEEPASRPYLTWERKAN